MKSRVLKLCIALGLAMGALVFLVPHPTVHGTACGLALVDDARGRLLARGLESGALEMGDLDGYCVIIPAAK